MNELITHNLTQGSQEWHNFRSQHFGASEAAAMLGLSKYMTREELIQKKLGIIDDDISDYQQAIFDNGHEAESKARAILLNDGFDLYPATFSREKLSASCDGITLDHVTAFEHKLWNQDLANYILENNAIPDTHMPQCQQILYVTGADELLFVCSDGTNDKWIEIEINPDQAWFDKLVSGWNHFEADMQNYIQEHKKERPAPSAIMQLPSLLIQIKGEVTQTNLPDFKQAAETFIANIKTDLQTDEDFANAEETVKFCDDTEKKLEAAKSAALAQTSSIDEVMRTIDFIKESIRAKRLTLEKLVKTQKEVIKKNIIDSSLSKIHDYARSLNPEFSGLDFLALCNVQRTVFESACKNKRTLSSLQNAVDAEAVAIKTRLDDLARIVKKNLAALPADLSLFRDLQQIITKNPDDFAITVGFRLAEQERKEKEATARAIEIERLRAEKQKEFEAQLKAKQEREEPQIKSYADEVPYSTSMTVAEEEQCLRIPVAYFKELRRKADTLDALIAAGVDNWDGYEIAMDSLTERS